MSIDENSKKIEEAKVKVGQTNVESSLKSSIPDNDFSLEKLVKFGILEKEVEPMPGLKVTFHTLEDEEREKAFSLMEDRQFKNLIERLEAQKRPILSYAITKINGKEYKTDEQKAILLKALHKTQSLVVDSIYSEYLVLIDQQLNIIKDGFKKKF